MKRLLFLAIAATALAAPAPASAGTYEVKACHGFIGNGSWVAENSTPYANANAACNAEGLVVSNTVTSGRAPIYAGARLVMTAPPGTYIWNFDADVNQNAMHGWHAGLSGDWGWIWCGPNCTSWGSYKPENAFMETSVLRAQVICADSNGCLRPSRNGLLAMRNVVVTIVDNNAPSVAITGGSVTSDGWRRGDQEVAFYATDTSGIRRVRVLVDGVARVASVGTCVEWTPRPCNDLADRLPLHSSFFAGDGRHTVTVRAEDAATNTHDVSRVVLIDNTPPVQPLDVQLERGDGWRAENAFTIRWQNPEQAAAPVAAARYRICPNANAAGDASRCVQGAVTGRNIQALTDVQLPGPGDWRLTLWLEDEAGNTDPERSTTIRGLGFDSDAPELKFDPQRAADPTRVRVTAHDKTSAVGEAWVEARRRGERAWRSLPTTLESKGFSAILDDERLPEGRYDLRARARDLAGNERTIDEEADGSAATRSLPIRLGTRLAVGRPTRVRARRTRGKRRYRTVLVVSPRARYGRTIPLRGRLTMPGANPLAGAQLEVWQRIKLPTASWRRVGQVRTSATGRFRFKALRGPSRFLRFRYPGTATIRARSTQVDLRVRAATSMKVTKRRVVNGEEVRFHGRLKGRQTGDTGKLIHLQVYTRGRWATFATPRASRRTGTWSVPYRFTATRGTITYRFRALIPRESSFPYETGTSRSVRVSVRGL